MKDTERDSDMNGSDYAVIASEEDENSRRELRRYSDSWHMVYLKGED
jgi:hypothetical protein